MTGGPSIGVITRTAPQLYRDCLRLIYHISGRNSVKTTKLKLIVSKEFKKNAGLSDPQKIDNLKSNAVKGLANYLMLESSMKDEKISKNAKDFMKSETDSIRK